MRRQIVPSLIALIVILFISACSGTAGLRSNFSDEDRKIIMTYYKDMSAPPTPGPGRYRTKPAQIKDGANQPNIMSKKLARGAAYPLPPKLERQLSPLNRGLARAMVGWNVVIMDLSSRKVVDRVHAMGY